MFWRPLSDKPAAYCLDGYMTAFFDGHHMTFAVALRHEKVKALVISPITHRYAPNMEGGRVISYFLKRM